MTDDLFTLYNLKVEVLATDRPFVCSHKEGDYFIVEGENLIFPQTKSFSMYALSALLPLLPAKQRLLQENDWMRSDALIACPDPNCGAVFKITRNQKRQFSHAETTVVPVSEGDED
ncbi:MULTISPECIES: TIGR04076 family protein [Aerococcus]|uniref:TIGR04076 family protein n=1 Tax=Aerococcus sanguinicola TaxID=119206 RepID=A0A5N1GJY9_9LACT|nr:MULTISPECIES: TIGR04076 family protein [Aerococcus]KAA9300331.1 TIGR04076 family protein [Aerococcus sanguinicola]MDK6369866.1 TIGR04076 family protein [Aerococcus sp. UMB9870]MDK6678858.1 TIGR04076 family protein [Aerococcus sp. UMB8608]MDK6686824.1 TIGR04076 family protein [Aerococcus sp. UMB8623]MDK6939516.1 TIGR04076 family protein [Aerococcus sp. UMB8487]